MPQIISLIFFFNLVCVSTSFTLNLLHRDSPHSPLFQPNISHFQRFKKNIQISQSPASLLQQYTQKNSNFLQNDSFRLPIKYYEPIFTVEVSLGTPVVKRTLIFDTGSGVTWTQCKPCIGCFKQQEPLFDAKRSRSYKRMPKNNKLAKEFVCTRFGCAYYVGYYSGQHTAGVASLENFTFQSSAGLPQTVPDLVFGCGITSAGSFPTQISGIFGMDREPASFARQLGSKINHRFSYCLPLSDKKESYLKFGGRAVTRASNFQTTPFLRNRKNAIFYALNLSDISFGRKRLGLRKDTFADGCLIDSGSSVSLLNKIAFGAAKTFISTYFSKFKNVRRYVGRDVPKELMCYTVPIGFRNFPEVTFHFQGANFHVPPGNVFLYVKERIVCLAMIESPSVTILGAYQQRNVRIIYDLKDEMLAFAPEDCSNDQA